MINVNRKAFLDMLAWSEGVLNIPGSDNGYNVLVGSLPHHPLLFDNYGAHPHILNKELNSTAAGRYQINFPTWKVLQERLGLPDFSPPSQDAAALELIQEKGALPSIDKGLIAPAIFMCAPVWASLPGNKAGQRQNGLDTLKMAYSNAGGSFQILA